MRHYLHYWAPDRVRLAFDGVYGPINEIASGWYHRLGPGDVVWLLAQGSNEVPVLINRFVADDKPRLLKRLPTYAIGNSVYFNSYSLRSAAQDSVPLRAVPVGWGLMRRLRFHSSSRDRIRYRGQDAFLADLAALRRLTPESAEVLEAAWRTDLRSKRPSRANNAASVRAALFGDPESNQATERAAIRVAREWLEARGWHVRSVEADKVGYDLHCTKPRSELHVEVKGRAGAGQTFMLTRGECRLAEVDPHFVLFLVVLAKSQEPKLTRILGNQLRDKFILTPTTFLAAPKRKAV